MSVTPGRRVRAGIATTAVTAIVLGMPGMALADTLADSITSTTAPLALVAGDPSSVKTATIWVDGNKIGEDGKNTDPDNGCNFDTAAEYLTVKFVEKDKSQLPAGVTVSGSGTTTFETDGTLKLTKCSNDGVQNSYSVAVQANSNASGSPTIVAQIVKNATDGTFSNQVSIPLDINRAPTVATAAADSSKAVGQAQTTSGNFADADAGTTLTISKESGEGSVTANADGSWNWS